MKHLLLVFLLAASSSQVLAEDLTPKIKQEAQNCANALLASDFPSVIKYTHSRVVAGVGGEKAMNDLLIRGTMEMRAQGFGFEEAKIGDPGKIQKTGGWLVSIVPQKVVMKAPGGHLQSESYLLGISEDEGKKWVFLDLSPINTEQLAKLFPELAGKVQVPAKKEPIFKKD